MIFLLLGLLVIYLMSIATPYQKEIKHGPSPEVSGNPYLAAETFLEARQISVARADGLEVLSTLPSAGNTLLLLGTREKMTPRQTERVLDWAAKGGHLLVVAESLWDEEEGKSDDLLLDKLGIHQLLTEDLDKDTEVEGDGETEEQAEEPATEATQDNAAVDEEIGDVDADPYPELTKLYLENEDAPAYVNFDTDYHLFDAKTRPRPGPTAPTPRTCCNSTTATAW